MFVGAEAVLDGGVGGPAHEDVGAQVFGGGFESSGEVDGVADGGVVHTLGGADVSDDGVSGVDADADADGVSALGVPLLAEFRGVGRASRRRWRVAWIVLVRRHRMGLRTGPSGRHR